MMRWVIRLVLISSGLIAWQSSVIAQSKIVAYVPNWVDLKTFSTTIDYSKMTHINIAFENPANDDGDLSFDVKNEVLIEKARANHVKILISLGGGSASEDKVLRRRYTQLLSTKNRSGFVARIAGYLAVHHLDGIDVDIEGPSINGDYGDFIAELAVALRPKQLLLTAALSQGYGGNKVPDAVFAHLDFVNVMAYDAAGPWDPKSPGQHSSLAFAKSNVAYWLNRGLPKSKLVLGVPFYGYGFGKAFRKGDYSFAAIVKAHPGAEKLDQVGDTIFYNGIPTIQAKAKFVVDEGLAGMMIWSLDEDAAGERSLLAALHTTLTAVPPSSKAK